MVDTFPRVGDWTADKLTLNYKHFVECHPANERSTVLLAKQPYAFNSIKTDTVQNYFILCAQNTKESMCCACAFSRHGSAQSSARRALGLSTIDHENRGAFQDFVIIVRTPASAECRCVVLPEMLLSEARECVHAGVGHGDVQGQIWRYPCHLQCSIKGANCPALLAWRQSPQLTQL